jgi:hypothetical protein
LSVGAKPLIDLCSSISVEELFFMPKIRAGNGEKLQRRSFLLFLYIGRGYFYDFFIGRSVHCLTGDRG